MASSLEETQTLDEIARDMAAERKATTVDVGGPRYTHDCDLWGPSNPDNACRFLGRMDEFDLYIHPRDYGHVEVIARYGDDGPEYDSGPQARDLAHEFIAQGFSRGSSWAPRS